MRRITTIFFLSIFVLAIEGKEAKPENWACRYNGPANRNDVASFIATDPDGNIYVAGTSQGAKGRFGTLTIKYSPDGVLLWANRYEGMGKGKDKIAGLAVDLLGNAYVSGSSVGIGTGSDFATLKYDRDGNTVWENRYNGPKNRPEEAKALALDSEGNVYVTGLFAKDILTVKYDPGGNQLWVRQYNGQGKRFDMPVGIGADLNGNVYVVGTSDKKNHNETVVLKYGKAGDLIWERYYTGLPIRDNWPVSAVVDPEGNIHIAIERADSMYPNKYLAIKYSAEGDLLWEGKYKLGQDCSYNAHALALDGGGNVYVTGKSSCMKSEDYKVETYKLRTTTVKFDSSGNFLWAASIIGKDADHGYIPPRIAIDIAGNVYVAKALRGVRTYDYVTIKYDADGNEMWAKRYDGESNGMDHPFGITTDKDMNVYVTGKSKGEKNFDFATVKYFSE